MVCLSPVDSWKCGTTVAKDGVISPRLVFSSNEALKFHVTAENMERNYIPQPCGHCLLCQMRKRRDMALRISQEASLYPDQCCFVTLTYNDDCIPTTDFRDLRHHSRCEKMMDRGLGSLPFETLLPSDVQKFLKRLRRHLEYLPKHKKDNRDHVATPIRYFAVGEYGTKSNRPHYHLIIFGWRPSDMVLHEDRGKYQIYRSAQLEKLWQYGFSTVSMVNSSVAKYCAQYVTKKFARIGSDDPFANCVIPEFTLQSVRHGGIGAPFFDLYGANMLLKGHTTYRTNYGIVKAAIPRYYWRRGRQKYLTVWLRARDQRLEFIRTATPLSRSDVDARARTYEYLLKTEADKERI